MVSQPLWDADLGESPVSLKGHSDEINMVAISADSRRVASASEDKTLIVWNLPTGKKLLTLDSQKEAVTSIAFSPDGNRLVGGTKSGVKIWQLQDP